MNWTSGFCEVNGIRLHYLRTGGRKPPLVLLHGLIGSGDCWTPVARLLEDNYDVVMPDARGHGSSSAPTSGYTYDDLSRDAIGLMQELNLVSPVLVGHSMGGMTAAVVASQFDGLAALALADPTFLSSTRQNEVYSSDVADQHRQMLAMGEQAVLDDYRSRYFRRSPELVELLAKARLRTRPAAFQILTPPNPDYRRLMRTIRVKALLVMGDSGVVSLETARELQSLNPQLEVQQIKGVGHGLHYDQPESFAAVLRSFVPLRTEKPRTLRSRQG